MVIVLIPSLFIPVSNIVRVQNLFLHFEFHHIDYSIKILGSETERFVSVPGVGCFVFLRDYRPFT